MVWADASRNRPGPANGALVWAVALGLSPALSGFVHAHATLATSIRHDVRIVVSPVNIDLIIELTFHQVASLAERRLMDIDHGSTISEGEIEAYLVSRREVLSESLLLTVDGQVIELTSLFDPQIDLLGSTRVNGGSHVLKLYYFARTPPSLAAGSEIVVSNALWPSSPAIVGLQASGRDGVEMRARGPASDPFSAADSTAAREFIARCVSISSGSELSGSTMSASSGTAGGGRWASIRGRGFVWVLVIVWGIIVGFRIWFHRRREVESCNMG